MHLGEGNNLGNQSDQTTGSEQTMDGQQDTPDCCAHPPRARLVVRVGVTGHRPGGLADADTELLQKQVDSVLACVRDTALRVAAKGLFSEQPPCLRVISSLAEGADRLVAQRGLHMGYELQAPLPYARAEYEKDFASAESREEFHALLRQSSSVFEIDGTRQQGALAYLAAGRLLIHHCDVLIAIWNGQPAAGVGGTSQIVEEALKLGLPVVRIDSRAPHSISYNQSKAPLRDLELAIERLLLPENFATIGPGHKKTRGDLCEAYFKEKRPSWRSPVYRLFERFVAQGTLMISCKLGKGDPLHDLAVYRHFDWATSLGVFYAELVRSAMLLTQLLAVFAVSAAVLPLFPRFNRAESYFVGFELGLILIIVVIVFLGAKFRWHERWLAYRMLAEQLRVLDYLAALAQTLPAFRPPAYHDRSDTNLQWANWHFRAIVREVGLKNGKVDAAYLGRAHAGLLSVLVAQRDFHDSTAHRSHTAHHRLHVAGQTLFYLTLLACALHLSLGKESKEEKSISSALIIFAAALPAAGAALAGILGHAEFERVGNRSLAMSHGLDSLVNRLNQDSTAKTFGGLSGIAGEAALIMTAEVQDWHVLFKGRPIELPS
jgi:hypothetical protein